MDIEPPAGVGWGPLSPRLPCGAFGKGLVAGAFGNGDVAGAGARTGWDVGAPKLVAFGEPLS